jgi:uncharacterized protein with von Willebrand factor type A (vWA) domain
MHLFDLKGLFGKYKTFAIEPDGYCRVAWRNRKRRSTVIQNQLATLQDQDLDNLSSDVFQSLMNGEFEESFEAQKWAEDCFSVVQDVEEFEMLQEMCAGDPDFSAISTADLMKSMASELRKIKALSTELEDKQNQLNNEQDSDAKEELVELMDEIEFQIEQTQKYASTKVQKASMDAMKKVQELEKAKSDGFFSSGDGSPNQLDNQQRRFDLVQRFQKDRTFKMVLELAGRIQKFGDDAVVETTDVPEAFVGFTAGNNFDGIQLEDLSMMNDQDLENLFWAEYCDETLLVDLFQGTKKRSKGNIVICSDVSGSMGTYLGRLDNGDVSRHHLCRAFVFAAMIKCRKEDRKCIDISFNSRVSRATEDPHIALDSSCGGGTNFNYPMRKAINRLS